MGMYIYLWGIQTGKTVKKSIPRNSSNLKWNTDLDCQFPQVTFKIIRSLHAKEVLANTATPHANK